jgi:hypothetical protein
VILKEQCHKSNGEVDGGDGNGGTGETGDENSWS